MDGVAVATAQRSRPRIVVAGLSTPGPCGVRDHAGHLTAALQDCGAQVTTVWVDHRGELLAPVRLASMLRRACRQAEADVVVLHYSVFAYAWRGIPVFVPALSLALRRLGVPVVLFAHEFTYPWGRRGWRGAIHSVTQRCAFAPLVAASDAVIVTTQDRVTWIRGRRWLPRRPLSAVPVFSNISVRKAEEATPVVPGRVGVFGFGADGLLTDLVVSVVAQVHRSKPDVHLRLIGAPGPDSPAGRRLQQLADRENCSVSFSGLLGERQLSQELSSCEVVFHTDSAGPTSRKTTLAAALSHGRPVVAFDGPDRWQELIDAGAVELVPADERAATVLEALLEDRPRRAAVVERARQFAAASVSPQHTASTMLEMIDHIAESGGSQLALRRLGFSRSGHMIFRLRRAVVKALLLSQQVMRAAPNQRVGALTQWWKWQALRRMGDAPVVVDFGRYSFAVPRWSQIGGMIVGAGTHERNETNFLDALVRGDDVFIDVGANIGYYSVRYAAAGARVAAIEPVERAVAALQHSLDLNGFSADVSIHALALSDCDGTVRFDDSDDVTNQIGAAGARLVDARRLDTIAPSVPKPGPSGLTVLKVDAEGHDVEVLEGARGFLAERRPIVMCEAWAGGHRPRSLLHDVGYRLFVPTAHGLEPLPEQFHQANLVGVPAELMPVVSARLAQTSDEPLARPAVHSWGLS